MVQLDRCFVSLSDRLNCCHWSAPAECRDETVWSRRIGRQSSFRDCICTVDNAIIEPSRQHFWFRVVTGVTADR
jgi:hypothetical protein